MNSTGGQQIERTDGQNELLAVDSLTKEFGGLLAVDDLSFTVERGTITGFIGPNGAGKTTTFDCVSGLLTPTEGVVRFRGKDITNMPAYRRVRAGIARTFQSFRTLPDRTVVENIALSLIPNKIFTTGGLRQQTHEEAIEICERVGLGDRIHQFPEHLNHNGLLRMELGRALATDPVLILLDEPFAGLSRNEVEEISSLITSLNEEGISFVVIDHNMRGLLELVDRAFVIHFGSKIAEGSPDEIMADQQVQDAYLGRESGI